MLNNCWFIFDFVLVQLRFWPKSGTRVRTLNVTVLPTGALAYILPIGFKKQKKRSTIRVGKQTCVRSISRKEI